MSTEENVQAVKDFFAAIGRGDRDGLLTLVAPDIAWIIPGENWPLAGTHRGRAGVQDLLRKASEEIETSTEPREYVAQADRVLVVGVATGKIKATNGTFKDDWVFDITVQNGKLTKIREYIDTQALARASQKDAPGAAQRQSSAALTECPTVTEIQNVRPIQTIRVDPVRACQCGLHCD
jgi:ketosteroid isomerase-like protein